MENQAEQIVTDKAKTASKKAKKRTSAGHHRRRLTDEERQKLLANLKKGRSEAKTQSKKRIMKAAKAGLVFPVTRIHKQLKNMNPGLTVQSVAAVYLSAVLEYCVAEVIELGGNIAKEAKKKTIKPRHLLLAIRGDQELDELVGHADISSGGVLPKPINSFLLPKHKGHGEEAGA